MVPKEAHGIPVVGFGTMTLKEQPGIEIIEEALRVGYRHLDTAQIYGNEREVGEALRRSGVPREQVYVTTKVWTTEFSEGNLERSVAESLKRLQLSSVDLLLLHWPNPQVPLSETMNALCKVKRDGLTRHIGVANFTTVLLEQAVQASTEPLVTNQVEVHPFIDQSKVDAACRRHGLRITAYCPIARGKVVGNEVLERIAAAHGRSATQVALRYLVQQGMIVIPRTSRKERLAENFAILDFTLSPIEMADIATLKRPDGRLVRPAFSPAWDL